MGKTDKTSPEHGKRPPLPVLEVIKNTMMKECTREMADQLFQGRGIFLDLDQLKEIRENLSKVMAMVRLVSKCAWDGREQADFNRDTHAAMLLAIKELEEIDQMIEKYTSPDESALDAPL